jgi:hypothetical protein
MSTTASDLDRHLVEECFQRIAGDLAMIIDRRILVGAIDVEVWSTRAAGRSGVQISFKLGFQHRGRILHGALLLPLPEALTLAGYLMMLPDDAIKARRGAAAPDAATKDALMEVGNFVGGATDAALRNLDFAGLRVRSEGCQGVRAQARPAFRHEEGTELLVGRAKLEIHRWPQFEAVLMLPALRDAEAPSTPS